MGTKLSLTTYNETISWEVPEEDITATEIVNGFYRIMIGATFSHEVVLSAMKKFIDTEEFYE